MQPSNALTKGEALGHALVFAYTKVHVIVREARKAKWTQEALVERLMVALGRHESGLLQRIGASFYTRTGDLCHKRQHQGWGNARKIWDTLHGLLATGVKSWNLKAQTSKNR